MSTRYLFFAERVRIRYLLRQNAKVRKIARVLSRDPSTISREIRLNSATRPNASEYRANVAQWKAELAAKRLKVAKLVAHPRLRDYVQERLFRWNCCRKRPNISWTCLTKIHREQ